MEDEVVIIGVEGKVIGFDTAGCELGSCSAKCNYEKEIYEVNQPITHRPEYVAIRDRYGDAIQLIVKIDQGKSIFEKGRIVPEGKPIKNMIGFDLKTESFADNIIWYTSFKNLITHVLTNEFIEEKSQPFTREIIALDFRILCNGYFCNHIQYCKFFNHTQSPVIKSRT